MQSILWVRCYIDKDGNRVWLFLRNGATGFDILISLLKSQAATPITKVHRVGLLTFGEAAKQFEEATGFYSNSSNYQPDLGYQRMYEDALVTR